VAEEHLPLLRHGIRNFQGELLFFTSLVSTRIRTCCGQIDDDLLKTYQRVDARIAG